MRAFSLALAAELEDSGITVSCVSPGPVDTGFIMDHLEQVSDITFSQPIVTADDVAARSLAAPKMDEQNANCQSLGVLADRICDAQSQTNVAYGSGTQGRRVRRNCSPPVRRRTPQSLQKSR